MIPFTFPATMEEFMAYQEQLINRPLSEVEREITAEWLPIINEAGPEDIQVVDELIAQFPGHHQFLTAAKDAEFFGDGLPTVFHRGNRQRWRVTMELDHWLALYEGKKQEKTGKGCGNDTETAKGPCGSADLPQQGGGS